MESYLTSPAIFVHAAAACYVLAMLFRDQLVLRALVLLGTTFYIVYYYFASSVPLWEAIGWSAAIGAANIFVMAQIILERTTFAMSADERKLYETFSPLCPGDFRKLLKVTNWNTSDGKTPLTIEGHIADRLYYVMDSPSRAHKNGLWFALKRSCFVGEVSYIMGGAPTATVYVKEGGNYVSWKRADLARLEMKTPSIGVALTSILKEDLAAKVANSVGDQASKPIQRAPKMAEPTLTYVAPNSMAVS